MHGLQNEHETVANSGVQVCCMIFSYMEKASISKKII
jgi:hypothetical protein